MMTLTQAGQASLDELNAELGAAGHYSGNTELYDARAAIAHVLYVHSGPFDLLDSETNDVIREATYQETVDSLLASPEGHILVDGRRCYVTNH